MHGNDLVLVVAAVQSAWTGLLLWKVRQLSEGHKIDQRAMESMGTELQDALKRLEDLSTLAGSVRRCEDDLLHQGGRIKEADEMVWKCSDDLGLIRHLIDLKYENLDLKLGKLALRVVEIETSEPEPRNPEDDPLGAIPGSWLAQAAAAERGEGVRH